LQQRVIRIICVSLEEEVKEVLNKITWWRVYIFYSSPSIVKVIKSRVRWVGRIVCMERQEMRIELWIKAIIKEIF
jgi:hypothetical protein